VRHRKLYERNQKMPFWGKYTHQIGDTTIKYNQTKKGSHRGGRRGVRFRDPEGRLAWVVTHCTAIDDGYHDEVRSILEKEWANRKQKGKPPSIGFGTALNEVWAKAPRDLKHFTLVAYQSSLTVFLNTIGDPIPDGPACVSPGLGAEFARLFAIGTYSRSKSDGAKQYKRKPGTLVSHIETLQALWDRFIDLRIVKKNPWRDVRRHQIGNFGASQTATA
jgi:hypothetical protein